MFPCRQAPITRKAIVEATDGVSRPRAALLAYWMRSNDSRASVMASDSVLAAEDLVFRHIELSSVAGRHGNRRPGRVYRCCLLAN
jgi:hypothetical protein